MPAPSRSGQFSRIVAPFLLFIAVVAGAAWLVQNLPNVRKKEPEKDFNNVQAMLKFAFEDTKWDEKNPYGEFEIGGEGTFEFPFENISGQDIETGLEHSNCTCTDVKIGVYPSGSTNDASSLSWTVLAKAEDKSDVHVLIPTGGRGVFQLAFKVKPSVNSIKAMLWVQSKETQVRQYQALVVNFNIVSPIRFMSDRLVLGSFRNQASGSITCWSATRDLSKKPDSLVDLIAIDTANVERGFEFKIVELSDKELKALQDLLEENTFRSRVKSAVRIDVKVVEKTDNGYLDQGQFNVMLPLLVEGEKFAHSPIVSGFVHSDIIISNCEDGKIKLGTFRGEDGTRPKQFNIQLDPSVTMLTLIRAPKNLDVKLERVLDELRRWRLEITVPPNTMHFPSHENALITLVSQPTRIYLAQTASLVGNMGSAHVGFLPALADCSAVAGSFGLEARQVHIPVLGEAVSR